MKINGRTFDKPHSDFIVFPRAGGDVAFVAQAVLSFAEFDKICPIPKAPLITPAGDGAAYHDLKDEVFVAQFERHLVRKNAWFYLKSLAATPNLTWDTVDPADPDTWENWRSELSAAFFTENEIMQIQQLCGAVNSMNQDAMDAARARFIAGEVQTSKATP